MTTVSGFRDSGIVPEGPADTSWDGLTDIFLYFKQRYLTANMTEQKARGSLIKRGILFALHGAMGRFVALKKYVDASKLPKLM